MIVANSHRALDPRSLFTGVSVGGLYIASAPGNTLSQFTDTSGLGNHLTQAVGANRFDEIAAGYRGMTCYRQFDGTGNSFFNLPALSINRRSHALWCISRSRSLRKG